MLPEVHNCFTEKLLEKTGIDNRYIEWSVAPDKDMYNYHRYTYHRLSRLKELFISIEYNTETRYDFTPLRRHVLLVLLGHLYLDALSGPVKVFSGLNFVCNPIYFDMDYNTAIYKLYNIIHNPDPDFEDSVCKSFNKLKKHSENAYASVLLARLIEMRVGNINIDKEIKYIYDFSNSNIYHNVSRNEYNNTYNSLKSVEIDINRHILAL